MRRAVIASSKPNTGRDRTAYVDTATHFTGPSYDISLKLTVAVVSGFLPGDMILISSMCSFDK